MVGSISLQKGGMVMKTAGALRYKPPCEQPQSCRVTGPLWTLLTVLLASFWLWANGREVTAGPDGDPCVCGPTAPEVVVTCEPNGPVVLKVKEGDNLVPLSPEDQALAFLALEMWDGTRYQDKRCDSQGRMVGGAQATAAARGGVYRLFSRLYPDRVTGLRLLGPNAGFVGPGGRRAPIQGYALTCAGPRANVVLPLATVKKAVEVGRRVFGNDEGGEALLAFILGHELGHRASALTVQGDHCEKFAQDKFAGDRLYLELLADARGLFYAALAGYPMSPFAGHREVHEVLADFRLDVEARKQRAAALDEAFKDFDAYAGIYQTAISLIFASDFENAVTLLEWVHETMASKQVMVPEVKMALALALMMRAGPHGPWLDGMPQGMSGFACVPVYPEHLAMSEAMGRGRAFGVLMGPGSRTPQDYIDDLKRALRLLEEAGDLGVPQVLVSSAKACANLYLGRDLEALREQRAAEAALPRDAPKPVRSTLAANRDLIALYARVQASRKRPNWGDEARKVKNNQGLADFLRCVASGRMDCWKGGEGATCGGPLGGGDLGGFQIPKVPDFPYYVGQCPAGWSLAFSLPDPKAAEEGQSVFGVTGCIHGGSPGLLAVHVKLDGSTRPPAEPADFVLLMTSRLPEGATRKDGWKSACTVCPRGVSDLGEEAYSVSCPKLGVEHGVVFVGHDGRVTGFATRR